MGSGGMIILDEDTCMVDISKFYLEFTVDESCGKCTPCRIGTRKLLDYLTRITDGTATIEDLDKIKELSNHMKIPLSVPLVRLRQIPFFPRSTHSVRNILSILKTNAALLMCARLSFHSQ